MLRNITRGASGYLIYRGGGAHYAFVMHRISGLATLAFLSLHIITESTVFFAPQLYEPINAMFRNPFVMSAEIFLAYFVIFHGVNGFRIACLDLLRPDLWASPMGIRSARWVWIVSFALWLPALAVLGYNLLRHGFGID